MYLLHLDLVFLHLSQVFVPRRGLPAVLLLDAMMNSGLLVIRLERLYKCAAPQKTHTIWIDQNFGLIATVLVEKT